MSKQNRILLEETIFNLRYDFDCIGEEEEMFSELAAMTDLELESVLNDILADM